MRPVIYQLFVRHFSNMDVDGVPWGDKERNGCGTFDGVTREGLGKLVDMGITHVWLTGILRHATRTSYPGIEGQPESIVKGIAGSPYAVTDYYDVDPDLAQNPAKRMDEFQSLVDRCHTSGLIPLIDFIPNHVSRAYKALSPGKEDFGVDDDISVFFKRDNSYYYLMPDIAKGSPPFSLPKGDWPGERVHAKVTGNNAVTWQPTEYDWYETVKLNYGYDFLSGMDCCRNLPDFLTYVRDVPRVWRIMDDVLTFWQNKGIGGFRCDMAHMVPMPFWKWAIARARVRDTNVFFMAEAYDDHMKTMQGSPVPALLDAGFSAIYDSPSYKLARSIYESGNWANDFDKLNDNTNPLHEKGVRYVENHDEGRLCSALHWGGKGEAVARAIMTLMYASGKGPVLIYNGQEVGERAEGPGGFGGDNGRTSIFDYTCLPRLAKWVAYGSFEENKLSSDERKLRDFHCDLLNFIQHPALSNGEFYGLNWSNMKNATFGRENGEAISGHWVYAFLKHDSVSGKTLLVVCNLSPELDFTGLSVSLSRDALDWCGLSKEEIVLTDMLRRKTENHKYSRKELVEKGVKCPLKAGHMAIYEMENMNTENPGE